MSGVHHPGQPAIQTSLHGFHLKPIAAAVRIALYVQRVEASLARKVVKGSQCK